MLRNIVQPNVGNIRCNSSVKSIKKKPGNSSSNKCRICWPGSLNETLVKGKIVLCDYLDFMEGPLQAGAVGALIRDDGFKDFANTFTLPVSDLNLTEGVDILHYINTTKYHHYNFMISIIIY